MKDGSDGFVRADQIDLKSIDEQLERHLNKVLTIEKNKQKLKGEEEEQQQQQDHHGVPLHTSSIATATKFKSVASSFKKQRQEWEIDPSNLIIKSVIARGTFGTVHRGVYDGQDVAGNPLFFPLFFCFACFCFGISFFTLSDAEFPFSNRSLKC